MGFLDFLKRKADIKPENVNVSTVNQPDNKNVPTTIRRKRLRLILSSTVC